MSAVENIFTLLNYFHKCYITLDRTIFNKSLSAERDYECQILLCWILFAFRHKITYYLKLGDSRNYMPPILVPFFANLAKRITTQIAVIAKLNGRKDFTLRGNCWLWAGKRLLGSY